MTDEPSESNTTCFGDYTIEDSIWHILYFEIDQKKGSIFGLPYGLTLIWILPPGYDFFLQSKLVVPLANLY